MAAATRLGVFGGTFEPVHNGHLVAALAARHVLALDRVLMVPAREPWQKQDRALTPADDRWAMLEAAVDGIDGLEVSRVELDRSGPSFTADTLEELARGDPDATLFLIVGADAARDLPTWDRPEVIRELAVLVVVSRVGVGEAGAPGPGWRTEVVPIPALDISSTDLRRRAAAGEPLEGLMPLAAVRCLRERGLYPARE